jgi:adenine-specific DNA-methyltransferase
LDRLTRVSTWPARLGLMPVPLLHTLNPQNRHVLLNGTSGNFCFDTDGRPEPQDARNIAWSSNVGHYVAVDEEFVYLHRWDRGAASMDRYRLSEVEEKLELFHRRLEEGAPKQDERSVIAHTTRAFRTLRAGAGHQFSGNDALRAFLYLLASATDQRSRGAVDLERWALDPAAEGAASVLSTNVWDRLHEDLALGRPLERLTPNLELVLRHASGQLFQEAHYIALHSPQQDLFADLLPTQVAVKRSAAATGVHFTPPALARSVVEEALAALGEDKLPQRLTIFDPACGSGEFLREAVRQLALRPFSGTVRVIGYDISPAACEMARFVLAWETRDLRDRVRLEIECRDSLETEEPWPDGVDLCLMNPPFVSYERMTNEQREIVARALVPELGRRHDMSTAFVWKAARVLAPGGVLGTIIPASFFDGENAAPVRAQIAEELATHLVARLGSHQLFSDALVDAGLYVGRSNGGRDIAPLAIWADHRQASSSGALRALRRARSVRGGSAFPIDDEHFSLYHDPTLARTSNWAPRPYRARMTLLQLADLPHVKKFFDVKQGSRTGLNQAFILKADTWADLPAGERSYFRPAVLNESLKNGQLADSVYVFYPYGERLLSSETELRDRLPTYSKRYLAPNKPALLKRARVDPKRWWELTLRRTWQDTPVPKIVSTYFGDRGSFSWDGLGEHVVVQGFAWMPLAKQLDLLTSDIGFGYLALLNSSLFSELLAASSNSVAGGQWNLSQKFVRDIPLPLLSDMTTPPGVLSCLIDIGRMIHESGLDAADERFPDYDEVVRSAYGISSML